MPREPRRPGWISRLFPQDEQATWDSTWTFVRVFYCIFAFHLVTLILWVITLLVPGLR